MSELSNEVAESDESSFDELSDAELEEELNDAEKHTFGVSSSQMEEYTRVLDEYLVREYKAYFKRARRAGVSAHDAKLGWPTERDRGVNAKAHEWARTVTFGL